MRLLHAHHKQPALKQPGFTLVEMLVVAPLALLVIAGLVGAMVSMIGDSLIASSRASTAYNMQDTLSQIEQDSRVATSFMGTFSYFSSPQGRDSGTAPFSFSNNNDLILTQQATNASPYSNTRQLIYYANQPASCSGDTSSNHTLFDRVVYFLTANGDGTNSLWRRTIINPWDLNSTPDGNTVCGAPWQRSSCPVGSAVSNTPGATCQSIDQKMLDNVTGFVPTFYTSTGATTSDPTQANSVSVSITVSQTISGTPLAQTSVIRASRRNDIPATPPPSAPLISSYNTGINSYNNPILTSVQWSSPGAYTYIVSTKVGAGAWSAQTTTSNTNMSIPSDPNTTILVQVIAVNDSGKSAATTYSTTSDLFTTMNYANSWGCYDGGTYPCPSFTRTTAGVVVLRGLASGGTSDGSGSGGTITTLPPGFRPDKHLIFTTVGGGNQSRIDVFPDGTVSWVRSGTSTYMGLDPIRFLASGFSTSTATPTLYSPSGSTTGWTNYPSPDYGTLQFTKDSLGRAYLYGLLQTPVPYSTVGTYSNMTSVPAGYQITGADIYPDDTWKSPDDVYASFDLFTTLTRFRTNTGNSYKSFAAMYYPNNGSASWQTVATPTPTGWSNYGSGYSPVQYTKAADNLVTIHGLIAGGTATPYTVLFTLPPQYSPANRLMFLVAGYSGTTEIPVRVDVLPNGQVMLMGTISNTYLSLAGISFYQDHS